MQLKFAYKTQMKHLAAYMLLVLAGKEAPTADEVSAVLKKVDVEVNADQLSALIKSMEGKKIDEVIAEGEKKLLTVGGSGAAPAAGGAAAPAAAAAGKGGDAKKDEKPKKEEKKEEEAEIDVGGGDLFGASKGGKY